MVEYNVFGDRGKSNVKNVPKWYQLIQIHTIFDLKHNDCHRSRVIVDGHLTDVPLDLFDIIFYINSGRAESNPSLL